MTNLPDQWPFPPPSGPLPLTRRQQQEEALREAPPAPFVGP